MAPSTESDAATQDAVRARPWFSGWRAGALIVALAAVMFLLRLGAEPLTSPNEGLYAEAAREMVEGHELIVPHINSVVYFEKPPLLYWLAAAAMTVFGQNAMAARLPSALAGIASVYFVLLMGGFLLGPRPARSLPAIVLATSLGFVIMARQVMFDALLCATITASLVLFWMASERKSRAAVYGMYAALALGVMTKGLMGLLLPAMVIVVYCAVARDWARLKPLANLGGLALFLALAVPWHVAAALRNHDFLWFYFVNEHVLRYLAKRWPYDFPHQQAWVPALGVIYLAMPWSVLLPAFGYYVRSLPRRGLRLRPELIFVLCWALVPLLFFTLSKSRIAYYMLPVIPPFALLVGSLWAAIAEGAGDPSLRRWVTGSLLVTFLIVFAAWVWASTLMGGGDRGSDRAELAFVSCSFLVVGLAAAVVIAFRGRLGTALSCLAVGSALALTTASVVVNRWPAGDSLQQMAQLTNRLAAGGEVTVVVDNRLEMNSSFVFYLDQQLRPVRVVEGRRGGDLEFGSLDPAVRGLFLSNGDLRRLASTRRVVLLTDDPPRYQLPPGFHTIMRYRTDILWANFGP